MKSVVRSRMLALLAVAMIVVAVQGCSTLEPVGKYFQYRYEDFTEMVEGGLTITSTPQVGLYWNSLDLLTVGYCDLDGHFVGFGGGQIGITRVSAKCWALGYGEEEIGWGSQLDGENPQIMKRRSNWIGTLSTLTGEDFTGNDCWTNPQYTPACVHFFPHVAYVGLVWNARWFEIADFAVGWIGLDPSGDDGYAVGKWSFPWRSEEKEEGEAK